MPCFRRKNTVLLALILGMISLQACGQNREANIDRLWQAMQLKQGDWAADIGSREGFFSVRMAEKVGGTGRIFAVDIDPDALQDLHENIANRSLQNITPVFSVGGDPMLPAKSFDSILIRNAYHEFDEPISMLRNIKKTLKSGGRLVIAEPIDDNLVNADRERQARSHDISMNYVKDDLQEAGFEIVEEEQQYSVGQRSDRLWLIIAR